MKKSTLRCLVLTCFFEVALCGWNTYVKKSKTWSEARDYCREHHADLSSISNREEDENLQQRRSLRGWIGLQNDSHDGWKWSGGQNASFFNWLEEENQPNPNKGCVLHSKKGWRTMDCNSNRRFYCFQNTLVLVKENKTWEEAMEQCREQHNDLVSLPSESALVETLKTSKEAQTDRVWTGLRYLSDDWLWVNGENVSYQAWSRAETPQRPAWTHHCGALSLKGGHLESWDCADKLNFVCDTNTMSSP
ncbi:secretory phospholipase A2 receptor-like [Anarrhichthys ocellatus]|uniref:secretory phospholipase A2 receptor-like n=1 Tax=Anarrhichthys ocellatus TaxID=433405 RepID=UPI0012ED7426|nr:secretory phospholipase A2 receptor-like [Anarrhichthys ocellatus]